MNDRLRLCCDGCDSDVAIDPAAAAELWEFVRCAAASKLRFAGGDIWKGAMENDFVTFNTGVPRLFCGWLDFLRRKQYYFEQKLETVFCDYYFIISV